jgi:hypothetical protein
MEHNKKYEGLAVNKSGKSFLGHLVLPFTNKNPPQKKS